MSAVLFPGSIAATQRPSELAVIAATAHSAHELAHTVVQSNDHLSHEFYETVGKLGAKLILLLAECPSLAIQLKGAEVKQA